MAEHFEEILNATLPQAVSMVEKRKRVTEIMDKIGLRYLPGKGTFYLFIDVSSFSGTTEELVFDLLINYNIAMVPGSAYGVSTKNFVRFSIGVESIEDIEKCLRKLKEFLNIDKYDNSKIRKQMVEYGIEEHYIT